MKHKIFKSLRTKIFRVFNSWRYLLSVFVKKRVYCWDLLYTDENVKDLKVVRYVGNSRVREYVDDNSKRCDIIDELCGHNDQLQILNTMLKLYMIDSFFLAREICKNDSRYKISYILRLKELRKFY